MTTLASAVDDVREEQAALAALLAGLAPSDWNAPTVAAGWCVVHQVCHLADNDDLVTGTLTGAGESFGDRARVAFGDFNGRGVARAASMSSGDALAWFESASARAVGVLAGADGARRVRWGIGMTVADLTAARLMEHWAHGEDVRAAVGASPSATDRLVWVAALAAKSLPYAFRLASVRPPAGRTLRLEVVAPSGRLESFGPDAATDVVSGRWRSGAGWPSAARHRSRRRCGSTGRWPRWPSNTPAPTCDERVNLGCS